MVATTVQNVTCNEQLLARQISEDNFIAYETLFKTYYNLLCHHAMDYSNDIAAAQDAVSEVFARIWEKRKQLSIEISVKSYLYRAVSNQCIDTIRKNYHKKVVLVDSVMLYDNVDDEITPSSIYETRELSQKVEVAVRQLPKQCGIVFRLSRESGLKYQEIANKLNISIKTVETQMGRAFKLLRLSLLTPEVFA